MSQVDIPGLSSYPSFAIYSIWNSQGVIHTCTCHVQYLLYTANEGPVRIQYKCLVPIYVFPEMKLCGLVISKTELLCFASQFSHSCICERFIYSQDRGPYAYECRNWERGRAQFHFWEYINLIFSKGTTNFCMHQRPVQCKAASFLKARSQNNYLNKKIKTPIKNLRIYATYVLAKAYPSTLCMA